MSSFFSSDGSFSLQFAIIFAVIFVILAAGVFVLRRFTGQGTALSNKAQPRGRQPRLGIVDIYELDRQRQLILLRRDNVEHLLLVGGPNDVVVERNITRGISARLASEDTNYDEPSEPVAPSQPSLADETPEPAPPRPSPAPAFPSNPVPPYQPPAAYLEPSFAMPVVVPAPAPGGQGFPTAVARPLDLPPRPEARDEIPPPQPNPAPRAKESQLARVIRRAPPSLVNLVPASIKDRVRPPEPAPEPAPAPVPEAPPSAPVVSAPAARAIDAAILSDMARQLEDALRRPATAVRPVAPVRPQPTEPAAPTPPAPAAIESVHSQDAAPAPAADAPSVDPIAAAMSAPEPDPVPTPSEEDRAHEALFVEDVAPTPPPAADAEPARTEPVFVEPAPVAEEPAVQEPVVEEPVVHAVVADAPVIESPEAPVVNDPPPFVAPEPPKPAPASKASATSPNPFSVEEIEAEFARLLGRPLDRKP